jgi:integrase
VAVRVKRRSVRDPATGKRKLTKAFYAWVPDRAGGTRLVSTLCTDRRAAETRAAELEREALDPAHAAANATTVDRILDNYEASRRRLNRAEGTLHHVGVKRGHLGRVLVDVLRVGYVRDLSHAVMCKYVDIRQEEGARNTTIKKELRVFGAAWRLARRDKLVTKGLDEIMPELEDDYRPRSRWLTPWELVGLAMVLPPHRMAVVAYIAATGCDLSAVWRARPEDVRRSPDGVMARIRGTKRQSRDREAPLPLAVQESLVAWALAHADGGIGGRIFSTWTNLRRDLADACTKIGVERCSPNDLRRTYAKWCRNAGIEPALVGPAMGHSDGRMVERVYGKMTSAETARLMAARVRLMSGRTGQSGVGELPGDNRASVVSPENPGETRVRRDGIEPPTRGFSVPCSTD